MKKISRPLQRNSGYKLPIVFRWYKTKLDIKSTAFLGTVNIPVLFVWGQQDELIDVKQSMAMAKSVKKDTLFQFKIFEKADHSLYAGGYKPVHLQYMKAWLKSNVNYY